MSRRTFVAGLAGVSAMLLGSCTASPTVRATSPAEVPDDDARRRWTALRIERDLAALVAATVAAHPDRAEQLTSYADFHRRHVTTLRQEGPLPRLADPEADVPVPDVPTSAADAMTALVDAEETAVEALLAACGSAQGPRLAAILASIAASDAAIATVVEAL